MSNFDFNKPDSDDSSQNKRLGGNDFLNDDAPDNDASNDSVSDSIPSTESSLNAVTSFESESSDFASSDFALSDFTSNDFSQSENFSSKVDSCEGATSDYNFAQNDAQGSEALKESSYYTENCTKPKKRINSFLVQLIAVALISSILGGGIVGAFFYFASPSTNNYFSRMIPGNNGQSSNASQKDAAGIYKKVEIQQSDSPVTAIAEKVSPSIVGIRVTFKSTDFFLGQQQGTGEGSGILIKSDGYIMTNNHVIENAFDARTGKQSSSAKIEVFLPNQKDKPYAAQVIGKDAKTDLAVLKIDASSLPAAELGNSDDVKVGELAVAIGNPGGLEYMGSVTVGVISGLNRTIPIEDNKELKLIQTDASINPGNSGGALVNSKGQVIGINTAKIGGQGFEGLGFAIPMNKAKEITDNLMQYKYVKGRPLLGITADPRFTEDIAKQNNVPIGVLVSDVSPLSGAYNAGIKTGDIITKFDGQDVKDVNGLNDIKNKHKPGDIIPVEIYNDGATKTLQVKLSEDNGQ